MSWYILWKYTKYNEYGKAYALYLLLQCHTEGICNHLSFAIIISNNLFLQGKHKCSDVNRVNVSVAMVTSLNGHFVVVLLYTWYGQVKINVAIMLVPDCTLWIYPPYSKSLNAKNQIFWKLAFFLIICHLQSWHILTLKAARRTTSGKYSLAVPECREQSSQLAHLPLQE